MKLVWRKHGWELRSHDLGETYHWHTTCVATSTRIAEMPTDEWMTWCRAIVAEAVNHANGVHANDPVSVVLPLRDVEPVNDIIHEV